MLKRLCFMTVLSLCSSNIYASASSYFATLVDDAPDLSDYLYSKDFNVPPIFNQLRFIVDMNERTKARELGKPEYTFILAIKDYVVATFELQKKGKRESELLPIRDFREKTETKILSMIVKDENDASEMQHWRERLRGIPGTQAAKDFMKYDNAKFKRALCAAGRSIKITFGCMMGPLSSYHSTLRSDSSDFDYPNVSTRYLYDERYDDRQKLF